VSEQDSHQHTIERFAEIAAVMDEDQVSRAAILEAAGIDTITWKNLERYWMTRLAAGNDPDLAMRFGTTYGRTRCSLSSSACSESPAGEEQPQATAKVDDTLPTGVAPAADTHDTLPDRPADEPPADQTVECAPGAAARGVLPFGPASPAASAVAPPGKRWVYFDTQTGQSLPEPVLVDAPPEPRSSVEPCQHATPDIGTSQPRRVT
jgi:hypothetical protein